MLTPKIKLFILLAPLSLLSLLLLSVVRRQDLVKGSSALLQIPPKPLESCGSGSPTYPLNASLYPTKDKRLPAPAVFLHPKGGIGNQLFQYACNYALARKHDLPLYIRGPSSSSRRRTWGASHREFALDQFNIPLHPWNLVDQSWLVPESLTTYLNDMHFLSGDYPLDKIITLGGNDYCQSESFFSSYREELLCLFSQEGALEISPNLRSWMERIDVDEESVGVHVRRGDALSLGLAVPFLSFYKEALTRILQTLRRRKGGGVKVGLFIFTDDVPYVEAHFPEVFGALPNPAMCSYSIVSGGGLGSLEELSLLRRTKHQIIGESSFGWWGAYLNRNPEKIVFAAHLNSTAIARLYPGNPFYVWEWRYLYYPIGWNVIDPGEL